LHSYTWQHKFIFTGNTKCGKHKTQFFLLAPKMNHTFSVLQTTKDFRSLLLQTSEKHGTSKNLIPNLKLNFVFYKNLPNHIYGASVEKKITGYSCIRLKKQSWKGGSRRIAYKTWKKHTISGKYNNLFLFFCLNFFGLNK
jgi:hypothetical protein